jgi:hypothetical protein
MSAPPHKRRFTWLVRGALIAIPRPKRLAHDAGDDSSGRAEFAAIRPSRRPQVIAGALALAAISAGLIAGSTNLAQGSGGGGTAKPATSVSPFIPPTPPLPNPVFSVAPGLIHGFDMTGFMQDAKVETPGTNTLCPGETDANRLGGSVKVNNTVITVPCNMVIQMPANTFRWAEFINGGPDLSLGAGNPSFELSVVGNTVGTRNVAGLMYLSQQSLNGGSGVISKIDYATGNIEVASGNAAEPVVLQINDPAPDPNNPTNGRFGRAQSPDPRLSVDAENPTIHAATGYPMCVPRTLTDPTVAGNPDDALCPQKNRPKVVNGQCRNFGTAGIPLPTSGELSLPAAGQVYCSQYVMPRFAQAGASGPDSRQQAPFEVDDFISYSGTLVTRGDGSRYISAHTIEANVGIYTQPAAGEPSYLAIGEFGVGTADPAATAINGAAQESQDRIFLEAETTNITSPVDIYLVDPNPANANASDVNRWITPWDMTGEKAGQNPSGGITTQFTGPQPQRARLRATKAPTGLLNQPPRTIRVANRQTCSPPLNVNNVPQQTSAGLDACLNNPTLYANGIGAGVYTAPVFEYIFPENVKPGDAIVPNDLWHLPFLVNGEGSGPNPGPGVGPLVPAPW